jgi:putative nucleotidyltransferase with HDIG domain
MAGFAPNVSMGDTTYKACVLVVDDEASVRALLGEALTYAKYDCYTAANGEEALALMGQVAFDAVITDLRMPGLSGIELLEEIRKTHPHVAVLMATAEADIRVGIEAMKEGADDYLVKPFKLEAVGASLDRALDKQRLEKELADYRRKLEQMVDERTAQLRAALGRIASTYDETLEALAAALDLRDNETAGHSRRVTLYSLQVGRMLELGNEEMQHLARAALLHDIGKIGIPDAILLRPGKLSEGDKEVMQRHVHIGYEVLSRIAFLAPAATIVLAHHERYDGDGYPQRLVGEAIPLGARIFAVADTLDAMMMDRPYRRACTFEAAREEIVRESGHQFDPRVVDAFLSVDPKVWDYIRQGRVTFHAGFGALDAQGRELAENGAPAGEGVPDPPEP